MNDPLSTPIVTSSHITATIFSTRYSVYPTIQISREQSSNSRISSNDSSLSLQLYYIHKDPILKTAVHTRTHSTSFI